MCKNKDIYIPEKKKDPNLEHSIKPLVAELPPQPVKPVPEKPKND